MLDFLNLVELFEQHKITFVSVTQSFNTTDAAGRMPLNIMMTFAQFEREVIGERIRDKIAASRKKGIWMGGWAPFGYEVKDRKLIINETDAATVRSIFRRFVTFEVGDPTGPGAAAGECSQPVWAAHRQRRALQAAQQPDLYRRGRT